MRSCYLCGCDCGEDPVTVTAGDTPPRVRLRPVRSHGDDRAAPRLGRRVLHGHRSGGEHETVEVACQDDRLSLIDSGACPR